VVREREREREGKRKAKERQREREKNTPLTREHHTGTTHSTVA
jgi:hypothetical protein